ncbi:MAG: hypothetical protein P8011_01560 [Acidihalobacter sp.]
MFSDDCQDRNTAAAQLYAQLDESELASVARKSILALDDIKQEARLICWSIGLGQSDFDPSQGSVRQYVMGRLWGLSKRYAPGISLDDNDGGDTGLVTLYWLEAGGHAATQDRAGHLACPLEQLLGEEEELEAEALRCERVTRLLSSLPPAERTWARLVLSGAPSSRISEMLGFTQRGGRYRLQRLMQRIEEVQSQ